MELRTFGPCSHTAHQLSDHASGGASEVIHRRELILGEILKVVTHVQKRLNFAKRCPGNVEKADELNSGSSSEAFSGAGHRRKSCAKELITKRKVATGRTSVQRYMDIAHKCPGLL